MNDSREHTPTPLELREMDAGSNVAHVIGQHFQRSGEREYSPTECRGCRFRRIAATESRWATLPP
jgi:hypothetical protein